MRRRFSRAWPTRRRRPDIQAGIEAQREHFDSLALQLGFGYGPSRPEPDNISNFVPDADIGSRMPHSWIEIAGERASSLDLLNDLAFTLVAPAPIETDLLDGLGETVRVAVMGRDFADPSGKFATLTGLSSGHCLLIRPDGHIAAVFSKDATAADIGAGYPYDDPRSGRGARMILHVVVFTFKPGVTDAQCEAFGSALDAIPGTDPRVGIVGARPGCAHPSGQMPTTC